MIAGIAVLLKRAAPISLALVIPWAAAAQPRLVFRSAKITPDRVRAGESMRVTVIAAIEGGVMTPTAVIEPVPVPPGPPPPVIVLGTLRPGLQTIEVFRYTVPDPPPDRACFNVSIPGGQLRGVCFKRFRDSGGRWWMGVDDSGRWIESPPIPTPAGPAPSGQPDLTLVGNIVTDNAITLRNVGMVAATNISVRKACLYKGRWMPVGGDAETRLLNIGQEKTLNVGKLGAGLGECPPGSTQVRIAADPANRIAESDENNNSLEGSVLADLAVSGFEVYSTGSGPPRVKFTIANNGADAGRFTWDVSSLATGGGFESVMGQSVRGLAAGQRLEVNLPAPALAPFFAPDSRRMRAFRVRVDPLNEVPESDETNNTIAKRMASTT